MAWSCPTGRGTDCSPGAPPTEYGGGAARRVPAPQLSGGAGLATVREVREWPAVSYDGWRETCDTLHAHSQLLGKLSVRLAPAEPQLQHAALRLTARGLGDRPAAGPRRVGIARRAARSA